MNMFFNVLFQIPGYVLLLAIPATILLYVTFGMASWVHSWFQSEHCAPERTPPPSSVRWEQIRWNEIMAIDPHLVTSREGFRVSPNKVATFCPICQGLCDALYPHLRTAHGIEPETA
jgi:hypothetical protein